MAHVPFYDWLQLEGAGPWGGRSVKISQLFEDD